MRSYQLPIIVLGVISISSCATLHQEPNYNAYQYDSNNNTLLYPESYESTPYPTSYPLEEKSQKFLTKTAVTTPQPAKDVDHQWISSQSAQGYTIILSNSDHPATVASALSKAPKNQRMAEIKYQQNNKAYYEGLYGSYASREAAEQAYSALPADVKQGASVTQWSSVQQQVQ